MKIFNGNKNEVLNYQENLNCQTNRKITTRSREFRRDEDIVHLKYHFPYAKSVLCVGSIDDSEIESFIKNGYKCKGIDVCTNTDLITKKDISELDKDFGVFDIVYCSHVLEHVIDPITAMTAIRNVSKQAIFIILPITTSTEPNVEHPTIYNVMKKPPENNFSGYYYNNIWEDFKTLEPYQVVYNCYRTGRTEDCEIGIIFKLFNMTWCDKRNNN